MSHEAESGKTRKLEEEGMFGVNLSKLENPDLKRINKYKSKTGHDISFYGNPNQMHVSLHKIRDFPYMQTQI